MKFFKLQLIALCIAFFSTSAFSQTSSTVEQLIALYLDTVSFEISDREIDTKTIIELGEILELEFTDEFLSPEEEWAEGKKRCTKSNKKGRKFCVQRISFLNWKFGWEDKNVESNVLTYEVPDSRQAELDKFLASLDPTSKNGNGLSALITVTPMKSQ